MYCVCKFSLAQNRIVGLEINFMGFFKAFLHCLLSSNGIFEMFDVILIPVPLWMPRFSPLEAYRIFTSCPVLEFENDRRCAHYLGPPSGMWTHSPSFWECCHDPQLSALFAECLGWRKLPGPACTQWLITWMVWRPGSLTSTSNNSEGPSQL